MATENLPTAQVKHDAISALLSQDSIKKRFEQVLGKKAAGFMSSVISAVNANNELKKANPITVVSAAAVAASLDLPINPSLGFAHIVPYKRDGVPIAQFQMGWRGYVQLGMRSGQYRTLNVCTVYEGELVHSNRFTGEMNFDEKGRTSENIIGYVAYFKLLNGFEKYLYMTVEQARAHGKRYSKSYDHKNGKWQTDPDAMGMKTVLKMLLSKFGLLSLEMQTAVQLDQATVKTIDGNAYSYDDNPENDGDVIDQEPTAEAEQDPAALLKVFEEAIPKGTDAALLDEFLARTAASNKLTIEATKIEFAKDIPQFLIVLSAYAEQEKDKKAKKAKPAKSPAQGPAAVEEMAPAPCPDNPGDTFTKGYCSGCPKRQGCPIWN